MLSNRFTKIVIGSLLVMLSGCETIGKLGEPADAGITDSAIVLTDVDFDPDSLVPETQPVADYLGSRLKRADISRGEVQIAPDVETVAQWMENGEVNLYFDSVYPAMLVMEQSGAKPILRRWKDGVPEYNAYFISRKDSGLTRLEDLQGKMITLQEPSSSSGFMFPMVDMLEAGFNPIEKAEINHSVASDEIGYVFSGQEEITVEWVLEGKVIAGAIDNETWEALSDIERSQLNIIGETEKFPRHVVLAGPSLTPEQVEELKQVMLKMDRAKAGKAALEEFSETARFDDFPEGAEAAIGRLSGAYERLQNHLTKTSPPK